MKEFEKWAGPGFYYGKDPANRPLLKAKRKGWKAALEWVLKIREESHYPVDTFPIIREELLDE